MSKKQIVNIINFLRGVEPRCETDLVKPMVEQLRLMKKYNLRGTFLVQYDALIDKRFTEVLKEADKSRIEIGVWFEVVQPLCEKAGFEWTGRYPWDWHVHCGFSVGYNKKEREKLVDILFEDFKAVFGYYPKSFGSWAFDAHTLNYASEKYGLDAACNCKDQWGTDGYTMWGGYYNQAYYPSKMNSFTPAQNVQNQINTPIFRMLGSDPIYQYDAGVDINNECSTGVQGVVSLEPVYPQAGGSKKWVDWYFKENFSCNSLAFSYTQAGQENSFGWEDMSEGLEYQFKKIADMEKHGQVEALTLGDSGRWYKNSFETTPPTTVAALSDWQNEGRSSVWYNCKNYRINLYTERGKFWIRDIYLFREDYEEIYMSEVAKGNELIYDNLPFVDGNRFCGKNLRSGMFFMDDGGDLSGTKYSDVCYGEHNGTAVVTYKGTVFGDVVITMCEQGINIKTQKPFKLCNRYDENAQGLPKMIAAGNRINLTHSGYDYTILLRGGAAQGCYITPENTELSLNF